jgi:hypothetical protein
MDIFIESLLAGRVTDDDFGYFVSAIASWRNSPEWLDADQYKNDPVRCSTDRANISGGGVPRQLNKGNWFAASGEFDAK